MNDLYTELGIQREAAEEVFSAERDLSQAFERIDAIEGANQLKVLCAMQSEGIALRHFAPTTGYGYDDIGRDTLDRVYAKAFGCEDALVRPGISGGTHALYLTLSGLLLPGDELLCVSGKPYDTLQQAIGISGNAYGSLKQFNVKYSQVELTEDGKPDIKAIRQALNKHTRIAYLQRSRGYAWRNALTLEDIQNVANTVKEYDKRIIVVVDNCYGEFTQLKEPVQCGADIIVGSLIKNPGGGLAPTGAYIAGSAECISMIEGRLTAPGTGREVGSYAASYAPFYQGFFLAPHVVAQSIKSAMLFARVFERAGMDTMPKSTDYRSDIIQAVRFGDAESLIAFIQSIQKASPVDCMAIPQPWDMPGYTHQVIMAAGTFVQGASIELSADAPIREPYTAYIQGALTYAHGRIGAMVALSELNKYKRG